MKLSYRFSINRLIKLKVLILLKVIIYTYYCMKPIDDILTDLFKDFSKDYEISQP
jgi:hypothetical protein